MQTTNTRATQVRTGDVLALDAARGTRKHWLDSQHNADGTRRPYTAYERATGTHTVVQVGRSTAAAYGSGHLQARNALVLLTLDNGRQLELGGQERVPVVQA